MQDQLSTLVDVYFLFTRNPRCLVCACAWVRARGCVRVCVRARLSLVLTCVFVCVRVCVCMCVRARACDSVRV